MVVALGTWLAACGSSSPAQPPTAPVVVANPSSARPAQPVTFTATSTDPQGGTLTYTWDFGDGGTATGATVGHAYATQGTFTATVTARDPAHLTATGTTTVTVTAQPPTGAGIQVSPASPYAGIPAALASTAVDPQGSTFTHAWTFGDGGTGTGSPTAHTWAATGTYHVQVTSTNAFGQSVTAAADVVVQGAPSWEVACSGDGCGAATGNTYAGTGVGVWRYENPLPASQTVDVAIGGVSAGQKALLLFTNGQGSASIALPDAGTLASAPAAAPLATALAVVTGDVDPVQARRDEAHEEMLRRNRALASSILAAPRATGVSASPLVTRPQATPAVGDTRTWIDNYTSPPTSYPRVVVQAICDLGDGRKGVFWVDPASWNTDITPTTLARFTGTFCGATGGFMRLVGFYGEPWGPEAAQQLPTEFIAETAGSPLDVNVVFLNVPASVPWGGYFWGGNNYLTTSSQNTPNSNEALVFFINAPDANGATDYYISTLVHELTHMVNFYQRPVLHGTDHATWLEETSAMMSEDIIVPAIDAGYSNVPGQRVAPYMNGGGAVSLVTWGSNVPAKNYYMGGTLGGYVDRRFGTVVYKGLVTCPGDGGTTASVSYTCLDDLLTANGGTSFADVLARMGASVFGALPGAGVPATYGFPATTSDGYSLAAIDTSAWAGNVANPASAITGTFPATTHTYSLDTIPAGAVTWARTGIVIPAKTSAYVVIH